MSFFNKILNRSNSYNYYKEGYENAKKELKKLKAEVDKQNRIDLLENQILKKNKEIIHAEKRLGEFTKPEIIKKLNNGDYKDLTVVLKTPNPKANHEWGDYFFVLSLKKSFEKKGFNVVIHDYEDWHTTNVRGDINLVLRGLREYEPHYDEINIMWNISHPDEVHLSEYNDYDICFISSEKYCNMIKNKVNTIVKPLLQCTDPDVFYNEVDESVADDVLFVGSTKNRERDIIKDYMKTGKDISIYGKGWDRYIDEKYIKDTFIHNKELHKYYSSCKILLNDHWEDMKELDFPSNRLFDALACGTFVISDKIPSAETLFKGNIVTYEGLEDLNSKVEYYLTHEEERQKIANKGKEIVLKYHTFDTRVDYILECLKEMY